MAAGARVKGDVLRVGDVMYVGKSNRTSDDGVETVKKTFEPLAQALAENEEKIISELNAVQGNPTDIGGYYLPDVEKANAALRPSTTLNGILDTV